VGSRHLLYGDTAIEGTEQPWVHSTRTETMEPAEQYDFRPLRVTRDSESLGDGQLCSDANLSFT
jgi:hypothetical protein